MMDALEALHSRVSVSRLTEPGPDDTQLQNLFKAAVRAADHGMLRPWRFLVIQGDSRVRLGEVWAKACAADQPGISAAALASEAQKPLRAPMIVVGIASPKDHPKVPIAEQHLATAAALQNLITAAHVMDIGAIWRSGPMAEHALIREALGVAAHETIIGFVYLGSIDGPRRPLREEDVMACVQEW